MPLNIHPDLQRRITDLISGIVAGVNVQNNRYIDLSTLPDLTLLDDSLPQHGNALRKDIDTYIGDDALSGFVFAQLSDLVRGRTYDSDTPDQPLLATLGEGHTAASVAVSIVASFCDLPRSYSVLLELPGSLHTMLAAAIPSGQHAFSASLSIQRIVESGPFRTEQTDTQSNFLQFLHPKPSGASIGAWCVCAKVHGFIPEWGSTAPLEYATASISALLGLCMSHRILRVGYTSSIGFAKSHLLVYQDGDEQHRFVDAYELPLEIGQTLRRLEPDILWTDSAANSGGQAIVGSLREFQHALEDDEEGHTILRGAKWLFESSTNSNILMQYVQATVCLEILLGDKAESDEFGLGSLLANRCAFLIGKTRTQREEVLAEFKKVYGIRSRIVHRGHERLTKIEKDSLLQLRWFCNRVIQEELKLLIADRRSASAARPTAIRDPA